MLQSRGMARRVLLRVQREVDCPLFRVGDQMVLELPKVDTHASSEVCPYALAHYLETADANRCETERAPELTTFDCPRHRSPVTFEVEELKEREELPTTGDLVRDVKSAVAHLRSIPIFRPLPAHFLARLVHWIRPGHFGDGQYVLQKGQAGELFCVVRAGEVEVQTSEGDIRTVVTRMGPGDCFGEMSILTGSPVGADVVAKGSVDLYTLTKADFERLLRDNPFMAARFTRLMAQRLAAANYRIRQEESRSFSGKLSVMSLPTVAQVLADSSRSGTLTLRGPRGRARIGFYQGRVYTAEVDRLAGQEAFYSLLRWEHGDFDFDPDKVPEKDTVAMGVMNLILEGMRRLDEERIER